MRQKRHTPEEIVSKLRQAAAPICGCPGRTGHAGGGCNPLHRGHRGRLRHELLDGEIFYSLREAQIIIESWRRHYNSVRPHASLGYRPPAPEVFVPAFAAWPAALTRPTPPARHPVAPRPTMN
jgi:putative transposase